MNAFSNSQSATSPTHNAGSTPHAGSNSLPGKQAAVENQGTRTPDPGALYAFAVAKLQAIGHGKIAEQLSVSYNTRMRSTAGLAYPQQTRIVLNPRLLMFGLEEVHRTLLHELAHLVAHHRNGRKRIAPHGPEWRLACADLGLNNEARCHDLPLPRRNVQRQFLYECPHCKVRLERVRSFRRPSACLKCCRRHNGGKYDERFIFVRVPFAPASVPGVEIAPPPPPPPPTAPVPPASSKVPYPVQKDADSMGTQRIAETPLHETLPLGLIFY